MYIDTESSDTIDIDCGIDNEHCRECHFGKTYTPSIATDVCDQDGPSAKNQRYVKRHKHSNGSWSVIFDKDMDNSSHRVVPLSSDYMIDELKTPSLMQLYPFLRIKTLESGHKLTSAAILSTKSNSELDSFPYDFSIKTVCHSQLNSVEELNNDIQQLNLADKQTYWEQVLNPDSDGDNLLFISIIVKDINLFLLLVDLIPDCGLLICSNKMFQTALHLAALTENADMVRRLVVAGVEVDRRDMYGNTALHIACKRGNILVAKSLLTPVTYIETKINVYEIPYQKIPQNLEIRNSEGLTCLLIAAYKNDNNMMELLLTKDANINAIDMKSGKTCLHIFAESGNDFMMKLILSKYGINVNARTYAGFTAAELAHYRGHSFVVAQLLYEGTDPNIRPIDSPEFQAECDFSNED